MTINTASYQCINKCDERFPLDQIIYRCPHCNDLLEVNHDIDKLAERTAQEWRELFDSRLLRSPWPYGSGVWGKKEWVNPLLKDENIISLPEGRTPLFQAVQLAKELDLEDLWIKQCGISATGSFKDLGMTVLVSQVNQMIKQGQSIKAVVCASTGDTSAALSAYCAAAGITAVVLLPANKISSAQLIQPIANGALTLALETDFDGCMSIVQKIAKQDDVYLANSMNSLRLEGQKTIAFEIVQQFNWQVPDWIIVPGGNLGNVSAIGKGFLMMHKLGVIDRLPRLVCAQAEKANPLYQSYTNNFQDFTPKCAEKTLASAIQIGNPVSVKKAIKSLQKLEGIVEQATEDELANAAALGDRTGLFTCPHTGVALAAMMKLAEKGEIKKQDKIVIISTASGLKFVDFKIGYHNKELNEVVPQHANNLKSLPPDLDKVNEVIEQYANTV